MAWIDFLVCLVLGWLGIHKFREKKMGAGMLYLLTVGLLGIGWVYDCCKLFMIARKKSDPNTSSAIQGRMSPDIKKVLLWVLTLYLAIFCLVLLPEFSGFIALVVIALVIPIEKWQNMLRKFMKGWVKAIAAGVLAIIMLFTAPSNTPLDKDSASLQNPITVTEEPTVETLESEQPTEKIIAASTEAPTQPVTESPTEMPTEPPTEAPTEKPTTPPTGAPTEPPATAPKTESTEDHTNPPATDPLPTESENTDSRGSGYILNKNSKIFHYVDCPSVDRMSEKNKVEFHGTRDEAIAKGYTPCQNCNP